MARFPTLDALATANLDDVMPYWAGLGYYARARNLHACAKAVVALGGFPQTLDGLRALPGVGPYTAAAVGAIAFGVPVVPVDGNVERVASRVCAITEPLPAANPAIAAAAARLGEAAAARARPADFAQALFDLGATLCTPRSPACAVCPWLGGCAAQAAGIAASLPRKAAKKPRPTRHGVHFWLQDGGSVLLRRRPAKGLLGGMTELPGTPWRSAAWSLAEALAHAPAQAAWREMGEVRHGLTHFDLHLRVFAAEGRGGDGFWRDVAALEAEALPSVMRKCARLILAAGPGTMAATKSEETPK
jgi:A/G-specific adenine glycosylase